MTCSILTSTSSACCLTNSSVNHRSNSVSSTRGCPSPAWPRQPPKPYYCLVHYVRRQSKASPEIIPFRVFDCISTSNHSTERMSAKWPYSKPLRTRTLSRSATSSSRLNPASGMGDSPCPSDHISTTVGHCPLSISIFRPPTRSVSNLW